MPKVLIENDSNSATWYYGKKGQLFDFTHSQHGHYFVEGFDNDGPAGVHNPDGRLVYTESEYEELLSQRDKAINDLARHAQSIVDLQNEKLRLQQEVDDAMDVQKVELPREVAEAIEDFRRDGRDVDYIIRSLTRSAGPIGIPSRRLQTLQDFADENRGYDLVMALINGYTIEQTPAEKLTAKVEKLLKEWFDPDGSLSAEHIHQATQQIVEHAEELIT